MTPKKNHDPSHRVRRAASGPLLFGLRYSVPPPATELALVKPIQVALDLSVVIPVLDEAENVAALCREIHETLSDRLEYEIIFVDDGSTDATADCVRSLMTDSRVRLVQHGSRFGQSAAIFSGVSSARAPWIATLDGDGQNDPVDLPGLWEEATKGSADTTPSRFVIGHRVKRKDSIIKRLSSRIANGVRRRLLRDGTSDSGCGIRVFDRRTFLEIPFFDHMHRFLPALFLNAGNEVVSKPVTHRARIRGRSKYGISNRLWDGIIDTIGVMWLIRRGLPELESTEEEPK